MVFIFEGQGAVTLDAIRKVRVARGNQDEVTIQGSVFFDRPRAVNVRVKAKIPAEQFQRRAFCK